MSAKAFIKSLRHAGHGIRHVFLHEQNFRIHSVIAFVVIMLGFYVGLSRVEWSIIVLGIFFLLVLEVINSIMEVVIDIIHPRLANQVKLVKDMMAGSVLLLAIGMCVIGMIIFFPYIVASMVS